MTAADYLPAYDCDMVISGTALRQVAAQHGSPDHPLAQWPVSMRLKWVTARTDAPNRRSATLDQLLWQIPFTPTRVRLKLPEGDDGARGFVEIGDRRRDLICLLDDPDDLCSPYPLSLSYEYADAEWLWSQPPHTRRLLEALSLAVLRLHDDPEPAASAPLLYLDELTVHQLREVLGPLLAAAPHTQEAITALLATSTADDPLSLNQLRNITAALA